MKYDKILEKYFEKALFNFKRQSYKYYYNSFKSFTQSFLDKKYDVRERGRSWVKISCQKVSLVSGFLLCVFVYVCVCVLWCVCMYVCMYACECVCLDVMCMVNVGKKRREKKGP